ncbi:ferric reductase like transmembrane component [Trichoderma sp. SZMC 28012]
MESSSVYLSLPASKERLYDYSQAMDWPYQFVTLSEADRHKRRILNDQYGLYAHLSPLVPIFGLLLVRLIRWRLRKLTGKQAPYDAEATSSAVAIYEASVASSPLALWRRFAWWLSDNVEFAGLTLCQRDQLIFGGVWAAWLLFLCTKDTGTDYHHLARRFGIVGISQLPMLYLLSLKWFNPVALILRTSHEHLNRWHRTLGRITYLFITFHGILYLNYYFQVGGLPAAFFRAVPALGMSGLFFMTLLNTTSLRIIRRLSYRLFFIIHILAALAVPFIIWFHVPHGRIYMAEALAVAIIDLGIRRYTRVTSFCAVEAVIGTDLVKIKVKGSEKMMKSIASRPGSHIYLSIPPTSRSKKTPLLLSYLGSEFISNPFTVASINEEAGEFMLIVRQMRGPTTKALSSFTNPLSIDTNVALSFDGPYGGYANFPSFSGSEFDGVLLFAGGVGATFILQLYKYIRTQNPSLRVQTIWATRSINEVAWCTTQADSGILEEGGLRLFCTRSGFEPTDSSAYESSSMSDVEMSSLDKESKVDDSSVPVDSFRRPNIRQIVNAFFQQGHGGRVGVVVCGPDEMAADVRRVVTDWVERDRDVWFHNESFGW